MNSETQLFSYYCFFLYYSILVCIFRFYQTIFWVIIIIHYNYIALFWVLKALYIEGGKSPEPSPVCRIHLDDATTAILHQNAHHTPAYWWRGDQMMKPISVWGWLGGHDGQRAMDARVTPLLFFERHPGIFNDHRESGPWFNQGSSKGCCFLQYSVPHRSQGEHPLLVSLTPLPAAT